MPVQALAEWGVENSPHMDVARVAYTKHHAATRARGGHGHALTKGRGSAVSACAAIMRTTKPKSSVKRQEQFQD